MSLGIVLICGGDAERVPLLREALRIHEQEGQPGPVADDRFLLGIALGFWPATAPEAEPLISQAMEAQRRLHGDRSLKIGMCQLLIAYFRMEAGDALRSALDFQQASSILKDQGRLDTIRPFQSLVAAGAAAALGQHMLADTNYALALRGANTLLGPDHMLCGYIDYVRGIALERSHKPADAETSLREAQRIYAASLGPGHPIITNPLAALGKLYLDQNRPVEAEQALTEAADILRRNRREIHGRMIITFTLLGTIKQNKGDAVGSFETWRDAAELSLTPPYLSCVDSIGFLERIRAIDGAPDQRAIRQDFVRQIIPRIRAHPRFHRESDPALNALEAWAQSDPSPQPSPR